MLSVTAVPAQVPVAGATGVGVPVSVMLPVFSQVVTGCPASAVGFSFTIT